jgi:hypothetical protein
LTLIEYASTQGGKLSEARLVVDVVLPLLTALQGVHKSGVVHRNIRPEHIMCSTEKVISLRYRWNLHQTCSIACPYCETFE